MDRRSALGLGGAAIAATLWPQWLTLAFAQETKAEPKLDDLQRGIDRARRLGKPLVVFVVPTNESERTSQGHVIGYTLRFGGDELLASLALAEIVCARLSDVAARFPEVVDRTKAQFFVISSEGARSGIATGSVALDQLPWGMKLEEFEAAYRRWAQPLAAALTRAVIGDANDELLAAREASVRSTLDDATLERVSRAIRERTAPDDALLERAAACFRAESERSAEARALWMPELTRIGTWRWLQRPAPGSRWADGNGAEVTLVPNQAPPLGEEDEYLIDAPSCPGCGMGLIPKISQRFLFFLTRKD